MNASVVNTTPIRVRYAHTDKMGIVYNGNYLMFFEIGRTELLRAAGLPYADLEREGFLLPVLEAHVVYHKPARYDEMLDIITTYKPEASPVLTMTYDIRRGDDAIVTGFTKHAFVDALTFRPVRPPPSFLETMRRPLAAPLLILACMCCLTTASAQQATLFPFLRGALSARSAGLAGSTVAMTKDVATTPLNPSTLTTLPSRTVSATFIKHVLDINAGMAIYADSWDSVGSFAATVTYMNYGSFDRTDNLGARLGTIGAADIVVGLSFAREIDTLISWGVTLKYLHSTLDDMTASAIAIDAGVLVQIPKSRTNVGLAILNVGAQLGTYDGIKDRLPIDVRIGVNHSLRGLPLLVNASLNHLADDVKSFTDRFLNFSLGGEFYVGKYVQLRIGYDNSTRNMSGINVSTQLTGISGGIGVNLTTVDVDYALSTVGSSALLHRMSVAIVL